MTTERLEPKGDRGSGTQRPWWGNPLLWIGVAATFVLLGIFVAPQLFGGVVLFVPFVWVRGRRSSES